MNDIVDLQCCVCIQLYSDKRAPKNLGCGHCVCSSCLEEMLNVSTECPECRKKFKAKSANDLNINHSLLRLSRMYAFLNQDKEEVPPPSLIISQPEGGPAESAGKCSLHGHSMFFMCMRCNENVCRDCLVSEHPDQPYGNCRIVSLKDRTKILRESHLDLFTKYAKDAEATSKKLNQIKKGYSIAVQYWENRPEEQKGEEQESKLEKVKKLLEEASKEFEEGSKWNKYFTESKEKMENANSKNDILNLVEEASKSKSEFEEFQVKDREVELYDILGEFWKGGKFKVC